MKPGPAPFRVPRSLRVIVVVAGALVSFTATIEPAGADLWRILPDSREGREALGLDGRNGLRTAKLDQVVSDPR